MGGGGAERVVSVWASQLAERGYDVGIFTYRRKEGEYPVSPAVKRLTIVNEKKEYLAMSYFKRYRLIRKTVKDFAPDVVIGFLQNMQVWMAITTIGLKLKRIDTVRISPWHASVGKVVMQLWKMCFRTGDLTILQSEDQKAFFSKTVQKKCVVVPNPLGDVYEATGKTNFALRATRFIAAGRICAQKNFPMLIKAFAKSHKENPEITLDIYGVGEEQYVEGIKALIKELNAEEYINLCGRTSDMHTALMEHDAFLMSSNYEGMPNALAEAMAVGLVCVSTDCKTGPRDLIKDGENGFLVKVSDVDDMSEKISLVANMDSEAIKSFGFAARSFVTDFCGKENSLKKLIEAIEK